MAVGNGGRRLMGPLLTVNFVVYVIVVGLAGWLVSRQIHRWRAESPPPGSESFDDFPSDICVACWYDGAMLGVSGIHESSCLEQCWTCKCCNFRYYLIGDYCSCFWIIVGAHRGKRLQTLEAFIAISGLSQLLYLLLLHAGVFNCRYGPTYQG